MCSITGFFSYTNEIDTKEFYDAHSLLSHRGPDDEGFLYRNKNYKLENLFGNNSANLSKKSKLIFKKKKNIFNYGSQKA